MKVKFFYSIIVLFSLQTLCMEIIPNDIIPLIAQPLNCYDTLSFKLTCKIFNENSNHLINPEIIKSSSTEFRTNMLIRLAHLDHKKLFKLYLKNSPEQDNIQNALHVLGWDKTIQSTLSFEDYRAAYAGKPGPEAIASWESVFNNPTATQIACSSATPDELINRRGETATKWAVINQKEMVIKTIIHSNIDHNTLQKALDIAAEDAALSNDPLIGRIWSQQQVDTNLMIQKKLKTKVNHRSCKSLMKIGLAKGFIYPIIILTKTVNMLRYVSWITPVAIVYYNYHQYGQFTISTNNITNTSALEANQCMNNIFNSFDPLID